MFSGFNALNQATIDESKVTQAGNLRAQGANALRLGQYNQAINYYTNALDMLRDPIAHSRISAIELQTTIKAKLASVYLETGNNHANSGRFESALTDYNQGIEELGRYSSFTGGSNPQIVQSVLTQNIKIVSTKIEVGNIFSQAKQDFTAGKFADALSKCDQALRKDATNLDVQEFKVNVVNVLMQHGHAELHALAHLDGVLANDNQISKLQETLTTLQGYHNRFNIPATQLMSHAYNLLGIYALRHEQFDNALKYYNAGHNIALFIGAPVEMVNMFVGNKHELTGVRLEKSGDFAGAVSEYRKALECNPTDTETAERIEKILKDHPDLSSGTASISDAAPHVDDTALSSAVQGMHLSGEDGIMHASQHSE